MVRHNDGRCDRGRSISHVVGDALQPDEQLVQLGVRLLEVPVAQANASANAYERVLLAGESREVDHDDAVRLARALGPIGRRWAGNGSAPRLLPARGAIPQ